MREVTPAEYSAMSLEEKQKVLEANIVRLKRAIKDIKNLIWLRDKNLGKSA